MARNRLNGLQRAMLNGPLPKSKMGLHWASHRVDCGVGGTTSVDERLGLGWKTEGQMARAGL